MTSIRIGVTCRWAHSLLVAAGLAAAGSASAGTGAADVAAPTTLPALEVSDTEARDDYAVPIATTATKTDTPLMQTPVNVQVIPAAVLQEQSATTLDKALNNVSGVLSNAQTNTQENVIVRGFSTNNTLFIDGFRFYDYASTGLQNLTNVERIEVMKGPAATLYGEGQPGGIVNLVSKNPQATPFYEVDQTVGSWNHWITHLDATGPLSQDRAWQYRVNAAYDQGDSWRDGIYNRTAEIDPSLRWQASANTQFTLKLVYSHNQAQSDNGQIVPLVGGQPVAIPRTTNFYDPDWTGGQSDTRQVQFEWSHQFDADWSMRQRLMWRSVHGWGKAVNAGGFLAPGDPANPNAGWTAILGYPQFASGALSFQDSVEALKATTLDLTGHFSTGPVRHTVLAGVDYALTWTPITFIGGKANSTPLVSVDHPSSVPVFLDPGNLYSSQQNTYDQGAYLQDQLSLPGGVDVLLGVRYQAWRQTTWSALYGATNDVQGVSFPATYGTPYDDTAVTPRLGVVWEWQPWLSLYSQYSDNFFPNQGLNWLHQTLPATGAQNKEIGVKYQSMDGKRQATLSWFQTIKTNVTTADLQHLDTVSGQYDFQNTIGAVRSRGIEFDLQGELLPGWRAILTYAYTDTRVLVDLNTPSTTGFRLANVPSNAGSLWTTYAFPAGTLSGFTLGGGFDARSASLDGSNTIRSAGYAIWNAYGRWQDHWATHPASLQLNVNNLFNRQYNVASAYDYVSGGSSFLGVTYGAPREVQLVARLEY